MSSDLRHAPQNATRDDERLGDEHEVEAADAPDDKDLKQVATLAQDHIALEKDITNLEVELAAKKLALKTLREVTLPLAMTELGMTEFKLVGGGMVQVKDLVAAAITEANKPAAHAWLNDNGHGDLIKRTITITFNRDEAAWAAKFLRDLSQRKKPVRAELKETVNYQTLGAFVREQIAQAKAQNLDPHNLLPYETLGVFELRYAEVKLPKAKAAP